MSERQEVENSYRVTRDFYGSNREKPLYTKTTTVRASSEQEAMDTLRKLVGGRNYRIEKQAEKMDEAIKPKSSADEGEYGYEGDMAMSQLRSIIRNSQAMLDNLDEKTDLPEWVQSKITLAKDYIETSANYLMSELEEETKSREELQYGRNLTPKEKRSVRAQNFPLLYGRKDDLSGGIAKYQPVTRGERKGKLPKSALEALRATLQIKGKRLRNQPAPNLPEENRISEGWREQKAETSYNPNRKMQTQFVANPRVGSKTNPTKEQKPPVKEETTPEHRKLLKWAEIQLRKQYGGLGPPRYPPRPGERHTPYDTISSERRRWKLELKQHELEQKQERARKLEMIRNRNKVQEDASQPIVGERRNSSPENDTRRRFIDARKSRAEQQKRLGEPRLHEAEDKAKRVATKAIQKRRQLVNLEPQTNSMPMHGNMMTQAPTSDASAPTPGIK